MQEDNEGFLYPRIDMNLCNNCGLCNKICPVINRRKSIKIPERVYACKSKNESMRMQSSSGGIFTILSEKIITHSGLVFGAKYDSDFSVIHGMCETSEGISDFRGSKYLQSRIEDNYKKAEEYLKKGRMVLFSGTPCQIAGLNNFLKKEYDNLLTVDFICHGVPSPKVFRLYLEELNSRQNGKIKNIKFRNKEEGWKNYIIEICRADGTRIYKYKETFNKNIYMRGFLHNLYLRPSCHYCPSKAFSSGSDITIGDYWGIDNQHKEFDDDKGCSLLMYQTVKGEKIFEEMKGDIDWIETELKDALINNPCILHPLESHKNRKKFFSRIDQESISKLIMQNTKINIFKKNLLRIKGYLKFIVSKLKIFRMICNYE
jgi:coenzyme F420-reducing hydrogenase beta subunit